MLGRERAGAGRNKEPLAFPGGGVAPRASSLTEVVALGNKGSLPLFPIRGMAVCPLVN